MQSEPITWEEVAYLPDCAVAALGDVRLAADDGWLRHPLPYVHVRRSGYGMLYALAECDGLPVEIGHVSKQIVAVRLEFVHDVVELEAEKQGRWQSLGRIRIGRDGAIAADTRRQLSEAWQYRVDVPPGLYIAQVFKAENDELGIRLMREP